MVILLVGVLVYWCIGVLVIGVLVICACGALLAGLCLCVIGGLWPRDWLCGFLINGANAA